jgi:hypothetical protein
MHVQAISTARAIGNRFYGTCVELAELPGRAIAVLNSAQHGAGRIARQW